MRKEETHPRAVLLQDEGLHPVCRLGRHVMGSGKGRKEGMVRDDQRRKTINLACLCCFPADANVRHVMPAISSRVASLSLLLLPFCPPARNIFGAHHVVLIRQQGNRLQTHRPSPPRPPRRPPRAPPFPEIQRPHCVPARLGSAGGIHFAVRG